MSNLRKNTLTHLVFFAAILVLVLFLSTFNFQLSTPLAFGQAAPEFLISWRAMNYVPPDYQGKILPSNGSTVEISFDIIDRNRIANLSQNEIRWFVNGELFASGTGLKRTNFTLQNRRDHTVRIVVLGYNDLELERTIIVPFNEPEVVIDILTPHEEVNNRLLLKLDDYAFGARPYFFNVRDLRELTFSWRINGQLIANVVPEFENILILSLESDATPFETELDISIGVQNASNRFEISSETLHFLVR